MLIVNHIDLVVQFHDAGQENWMALVRSPNRILFDSTLGRGRQPRTSHLCRTPLDLTLRDAKSSKIYTVLWVRT